MVGVLDAAAVELETDVLAPPPAGLEDGLEADVLDPTAGLEAEVLNSAVGLEADGLNPTGAVLEGGVLDPAGTVSLEAEVLDPAGAVGLEAEVDLGSGAPVKSYAEVGMVPGTYRIIDLFCLKDVLNQIMRCSCQSDTGFSIFQAEQEHSPLSFHCILDIMCKHCNQKISFGTSMIVSKEDKAEIEPDIDLRLDRVLEDSWYREILWNEFYDRNAIHPGSEPDLSRTVPEKLNTAESTIQTDFLENHPDPDLVICYICENIFTSQNFKLHKPHLCKKSTKAQKFQCEFCRKCFTKKHNLTQHLRIHTGNKIACKVAGCDKAFSDKSSMNKHVRAVHLKQRPHACAVCRKEFTRAAHLKEHMVVHTKEKEYKCTLCDKAFPFHSSLNHHRRTHTAEKRFQCAFCSKSFKGERAWKDHSMTVHNRQAEPAVQPLSGAFLLDRGPYGTPKAAISIPVLPDHSPSHSVAVSVADIHFSEARAAAADSPGGGGDTSMPASPPPVDYVHKLTQSLSRHAAGGSGKPAANNADDGVRRTYSVSRHTESLPKHAFSLDRDDAEEEEAVLKHTYSIARHRPPGDLAPVATAQTHGLDKQTFSVGRPPDEDDANYIPSVKESFDAVQDFVS